MSLVQFKNHKGLYLTGYSRAAHRTGLQVKGLDILLDAGLDVQKAHKHIFITHQHLDHVIYLPQYIMNIEDQQEINIISSPNILNNIKDYVASALRMSQSIPLSLSNDILLKKSKTYLKPITEQNNYQFIHGKDRWSVEYIKCFHGVESIGFGFNIQKIKLKEEYSELSGKEIKKLKDEKVEITINKMEPIFLFLGDTNKNILLEEKIYNYPTIIIECSYICDEDLILAKKNKHIHWKDIKDIITKYSNIQFILIHFSMKYTVNQLKQFFDSVNLHNINYIF
jgi:ribonuclease Z